MLYFCIFVQFQNYSFQFIQLELEIVNKFTKLQKYKIKKKKTKEKKTKLFNLDNLDILEISLDYIELFLSNQAFQ